MCELTPFEGNLARLVFERLAERAGAAEERGEDCKFLDRAAGEEFGDSPEMVDAIFALERPEGGK